MCEQNRYRLDDTTLWKLIRTWQIMSKGDLIERKCYECLKCGEQHIPDY